jgi:MATE family multidrug resistance protein
MMVAVVGESALAATTTGNLDVFVLVMLPMGLASVVQSFASQFLGLGDRAAARRYGWYGIVFAALFGLAGALAIPAVPAVLRGFPVAPDVREQMSTYIQVRLLAVGAVAASEILGSWFGGLGNTRLHMISSILAMLANIFFNWVFIYGHLGAPPLGVLGSAIASATASWLGFFYLLACFLRLRPVPGPAQARRLRLSEFWRLLRFGIPQGANAMISFGALAIFMNVVVAHFGTTDLAAMNAVSMVNALAIMPASALASAGGILAGMAIGAGQYGRIPGILRRTVTITGSFIVAVALLFVVAHDPIMRLFTSRGSGAGLREVGSVLLMLSGLVLIGQALAASFGEVLRASGDTAWCFRAQIVTSWGVFVPLSAASVLLLGASIHVAMGAYIAYGATAAAAMIWRYRDGRWHSIDLMGQGSAEKLAG